MLSTGLTSEPYLETGWNLIERVIFHDYNDMAGCAVRGGGGSVLGVCAASVVDSSVIPHGREFYNMVSCCGAITGTYCGHESMDLWYSSTFPTLIQRL
jgi:hypothetical protein